MKRQPREWEKIFTNEVTEKELISKYTVYAAQYPKTKQHNQKMGRRCKCTFL